MSVVTCRNHDTLHGKALMALSLLEQRGSPAPLLSAAALHAQAEAAW